jgi:hypothetical protein
MQDLANFKSSTPGAGTEPTAALSRVMRDAREDALRRKAPEEMAWVWLLGLASVSFGVGWFADAFLAMF